MIIYKHNADDSFEFREVEGLNDYDDSTNDGRLYYKGNEDDLWWILDLDTNPYDASDDYVKAFTAYRLDDPEVFAKAKKYENIAKVNSKAGKASANIFTKEERSERAKLAAEARWGKKD